MPKIWKMLKVFVSSTFLDLELERDQLNNIFEKIEQKILERRLTICPYDLRWRDRSEKESIVNWCLRLLKSCDYFVGILGNRYGWRPPVGIDGEENTKDISITEMEMRLALEKIPRNKRFFCFTEFQEESTESPENLESVRQLKHFLTSAGEKVFVCKTMDELLLQIEKNITDIINAEYPLAQRVTVIEERTYRNSLRTIINEKVRKFCGRAEYLKKLHQFANSLTSPNYLCLSAVAGNGKSALMAKFICERGGTKIPIIAHFMGMARDSKHVQGIMKNIAEQLVIWNMMDAPISSEMEVLQKEIRKILEQTKQHVILLIDGIDEVSEKERNLRWLPQNLPTNVRVILTTRPVDTLDVLSKFSSIEVVELQPLTTTEIKEIIASFVAENKVSITEDDVTILVNRAAGNPLYLKVALEELAASGMAVGQLALTIDALFHQIVTRLENQFASKFEQANLPAQQLIQMYLGLIAAGENGILEKDLKEILNVGDDFALSVKMALRHFIVERKNFLNFFHPEFELYIKMSLGKSGMRTCHTKIAEYLQKKGYNYYRTLEELPHQMQWSENYEGLLTLLTDIEFLQKKSMAGMIPELKDDMHFALGGQVVKLRENSECEIAPGVTVNRHIIYLLNRILGIDGQFLQRHPECLFQSFWNYGYWYDAPEANEHYPEKMDIIENKAKISTLVNYWRSGGIKQPWLQSKRPLPTHLDSAILNIFVHEQPITGIDISHNGDLIASGSYDNHLRIWDAESNKVLLEHEYQMPVNDVKFSPEGHLLYVANLQVDIWDVINNVKIGSISEFGKIILKLYLSGDGSLLAMVREKDVVVWDILEKRTVAVLAGHSSSISSVAISADKKLLATGSYDQSMKIWDINTQQNIHTFKSEGIVAGLDFSPKGDNIAIATHIHLKIWNLQQKEIVHSENLTMAPMAICYSLDGEKLAIASQQIYMYNTSSYEKIATLKGHESIVNSLHFTPDGNKLVSGSMDKTVRVWDTKYKGANIMPTGHSFAIGALTVSPNATWAVSASYDQQAYFWNIDNGLLLNTCSPGVVSAVCIARDNNIVAFATHDQKIHIWDQDQQSFLKVFSAHTQPIITMAFNEDGSKLASTSDDLNIHIWNWQQQECEVSLSGYEIRIVELIFKKNQIFSRSYVDERIWDIVSKKCVETKARYQAYPNTGKHRISNNEGETKVEIGEERLYFPITLENIFSSNAHFIGNNGSYTAIMKIVRGEK